MTVSGVTRHGTAGEWRNIERRVASDRVIAFFRTDPACCAKIRDERAGICVVVYPLCAPSHQRLESIMSVRTVASKFVELCRQGKNFDVMRTHVRA